MLYRPKVRSLHLLRLVLDQTCQPLSEVLQKGQPLIESRLAC